MSSLAVRNASVYDVRALAANLRREDREELLLAGWKDMEKAIRDTLKITTDAKVVVNGDGEILAMFGCVSDAQGYGIAWVFASNALDKHAREFARGTKRLFQRYFGKFAKVYNLVDVRYERCIKWLEWLGFVGRDICNTGPHNAAFLVMVREG